MSERCCTVCVFAAGDLPVDDSHGLGPGQPSGYGGNAALPADPEECGWKALAKGPAVPECATMLNMYSSLGEMI